MVDLEKQIMKDFRRNKYSIWFESNFSLLSLKAIFLEKFNYIDRTDYPADKVSSICIKIEHTFVWFTFYVQGITYFDVPLPF